MDNNVAARVLLQPDDAAYRELHAALVFGKGLAVRLVYGGRLKKELLRNVRVRRAIALLDSVGRARQVSDRAVDAEELKLVRGKICSSDDPHVIALARVSAVRLLCTEDDDLIADFLNKAVIDDPRGKVYSRPSHRHLLRKHCGERG